MHGNTDTRPAAPPRRAARRAPWRACLGLLLLAGTALTALPEPVQARNTQLWSATLTVGFRTTSVAEEWGYSPPADFDIGSLMPTTFQINGTTYEVTDLRYVEDPDDRSDNVLLFGIDPDLPAGSYLLELGSRSINFVVEPDGSFEAPAEFSRLGWSANDTVAVKLRDITGPKFDSAEVPAAGDSLTITFDEDLDDDTAHKPTVSRFTVEVDDTEVTVDSFTVSGRTVTLRLERPIHVGDTVTVSYQDPGSGNNTRALQDANGHDAPSFTDESVANNSTQTLPRIESAVVAPNGTQVVFTFNEPLRTGLGNKPAAGGFYISLPHRRGYWKAAYTISGRTVTLDLHETTIYRGERVRVGFTRPPLDYAQHLRDRHGHKVQTFRITAVNNSTQVDPLKPPVLVSAAVAADGRSIDLTFDEDVDPDNLPSQWPDYPVRIRAGGHTIYAQDLTVPDRSNARVVRVSDFAADRHVYRGGGEGRARYPVRIFTGQTVKVSYGDPSTPNDAKAIQDPDGNDTRSFGPRSVANNSTYNPATVDPGGTTIWSATLTVGFHAGSTTDEFGYSHPDELNIGSLAPRTFDFNGSSYRIDELLYIEERANRQNNVLSLLVELNDLPGGTYILELGSSRIRFEVDTNGGITDPEGFPRLDWQTGQTVDVRLISTAPPPPPACEDTDLVCADLTVGSDSQVRSSFEIGDRTYGMSFRLPSRRLLDLGFSHELPEGRYTLELPGWSWDFEGGQDFHGRYGLEHSGIDLAAGDTVRVRLAGPADADTHLDRLEAEGYTLRRFQPAYAVNVGPSHVYRADVPSDLTSVTLFAEARDPDATIAYHNYRGERLCDAGSGDGFQANLKEGFLNKISVKVTAADGRTVQTYVLNIAPPKSRSSRFSGKLVDKVWAGKSVPDGCGGQQVMGESAPLTATLESKPDRHDGSSPFTVRIRFSERLKNGALGPKVVDVRNGTNTGSTRIEGDGEVWEITIQPDGDNFVNLAIYAAETCRSGIACTENLEPLSADWHTAIVGPATPVTPAVTPLTAHFADVPDEHDGSAFPVRIAFSETLKNQALGPRVVQVTGGANTRSRRVGTESEIWEVTIEPAGNGPVTLALVSSETCGTGIACTEGDHRPLSEGLSHTVLGPWQISVADATAAEGATMDFAVSLSRPARFPITVDYATSAGTATAGADYSTKTGTLTFRANQRTKTVRVTTLQDSHEDGGETFTLTLSNPSSGAVIADGTATGTIENADAMPQAWLARFGRTVAEQVLAAVEGRMRASRTAGVEMTLAGRTLPSWRPGNGADGVTGGTPAESPAATARPREARAQQDAAARLGAWLGDGTDPERQRGPETRAVSPRDLLTGSSFALTGGEARAGFYSLWGRAAVSRFDGREGALSLDGDVATGFLGADWARDRVAAGLVVGHSRGEGGYRAEAGDGAVESTLTGVYPWGRYALSKRVSVWGVAGYGEGTLTLTPEGQSAIRADLDLALGAAGLRGVLLAAPAGGGFELAVKADALAVRTTTARAPGLGAADADATRLRLGLEGARPIAFAGGAVLTPSVEVGVRQDGGDAETGFGVDLGGGLAWRDPARGLSAELRGRGLVSHEADGIRERGFSGALGWEPAAADGQGPKLTLRQTVGASAAGGMDALLGRRTLAGLAPGADGDDLARRRFELRFGYGFAAFGHRFTSTPELALGRTDGSRDVGLGWRLGLARGAGALELRLEATRREAAGGNAAAAAPEHALGVRATARW